MLLIDHRGLPGVAGPPGSLDARVRAGLPQEEPAVILRHGARARLRRACARPSTGPRLSRVDVYGQGKGKTLSILAHMLGRAVYHRLARKTAFDLQRLRESP